MDEEVDAGWRRWVRRCVRLGAWLVLLSLFWVMQLVVAWVREGFDARGSGPLALIGYVALADIALLGNLGRWWMKPRWPGREPTGRWRRMVDPLGPVLPTTTAVVLVLNIALPFAEDVGTVDILGIGMCLVGLGLLAAAVQRVPAPRVPGAGRANGAAGGAAR